MVVSAIVFLVRRPRTRATQTCPTTTLAVSMQSVQFYKLVPSVATTKKHAITVYCRYSVVFFLF